MGDRANISGRILEIAFLDTCRKNKIKLTKKTQTILEKETQKCQDYQDSKNWNMTVEASQKFLKWFQINNGFINSVKILDQELGKSGYVSDVCLSFYPFKTINNDSSSSSLETDSDLIELDSTKELKTGISLKLNRISLKNHRPRLTPKHLGLTHKNNSEFILFQRHYLKTNNKIYNKIKINKEYCKVKDINKILYKPINQLVIDLINKFSAKEKNIVHLFKHLIGYDQHLLFLATKTKKHRVYSFKDIKLPGKLNAYLNEMGNIIVLEFDNDFIFNLKLHNAEREIQEHMDLKYSTTLKNFNTLIKNTII